MTSDRAAGDDPTNPEWAMRFDGTYWTFTREGRLHVLESDGTPKFIGTIRGATNE